MGDYLDEQIAAFEKMLPEIREKHGSVWAVVADCQLVSTFNEFSDAAQFAEDRYPRQEVLIRHTRERGEEFAPFIILQNTKEQAAIREALRLLDGGSDNPDAFDSASALLPAGGVECEALVGRAVAVLRGAVDDIAGRRA